MRIAVLCALAIALIAGTLLWWLAIRMRRRARALLAAGKALDRGAPRVFDETPMRHRGSFFSDRTPLPEAIAPAKVLPVFATGEGVFAGPLRIPHALIEDAALMEGSLRLRWRARGERIETWLEAGPADLERLQREIHLRQVDVAAKLVAMLGPKP